MTFPEAAAFFAVSFVAAAINSVAGGGTFLTFPVFIFNGLTALQANIMSTIALWPGTLASVVGYRSELRETRELRGLLVIGLAGGALGSLVLLSTPEATFRALVPWLLLCATLIFTFGRQAIVFLNRNRPPGPVPLLAVFIIQFAIAFYGGYFGAGIGILTLAMLQLLGEAHIHRMNAVKTVLTGAVNAVTALIFMASGKVLWGVGTVMVAGAVLGGYAGARLALRTRPETVRFLVSLIGFGMTAYFFIHGD